MKLQAPPIGQLHTIVEDEEGRDVLHTYEVTSGEFNLYKKDDIHWACFYVSAEKKLKPDDEDNPEPWIGVNIILDPNSPLEIKEGTRLITEAYDYKLDEWMTNMYYYSHGGLEKASVRVLETNPDRITVEIEGECEALCAPVKVKAELILNPKRTRSFN